MSKIFVTILIIIATAYSSFAAFGGDRVLLRDVNAITLYNGRMTKGRRSAPVPQLNCVGGTARGAFIPQVVQCINKGFDGQDVQWECKTDMDNAYRFGTVEVTCEGYDYPDDPYILAGSCGLEYTLDYTREGEQQRGQHHQYYGDDYHDRSSDYYQGSHYKKGTSGISSLFMLGTAACIIYFIYKFCLSTPVPPGASGSNPDNPPPYSYHDPGTASAQPPPPGFKPEFTSHQTHGAGYQSPGYSGGFTSTNQGTRSPGYDSYTNTHTNTGTNTGGGFWSGMATGGLLGYLFGNSGNYNTGYNSGYYGPRYRHHHRGGGWFGGSSGYGSGGSWFGSSGGSSSGWFGSSGGRSSGSSFSSSSSRSSGTRTASGFGGTKRR